MSIAGTDILYSLDGPVGTITLNRPQARNALTYAMYDEIGRICASPEAYGGPRVLVITGAGDKAFASGTDFSELQDIRTAEQSIAYEERVERVLRAIETCPVPTIAAIAGSVTGGGAIIASACDIRIATEDARFGFPIARTLGNCLSIRNAGRIARLVGPARLRDLVFTARLMEAGEGRQIGLYSEVVADRPALVAHTRHLAETVAGHAPLTLRATKMALDRLAEAGGDIPDADIVQLCYLSEDFREGMAAFLEKRPPQWKGR
ncbi:MAG TPA: enoyl-CoA hydratase/isomerase family protein [Rhabdaerophilum sp.]|nr:enoyl-CoA hydratase/isomerase family protein [Rhabdaerophilum sp.]